MLFSYKEMPTVEIRQYMQRRHVTYLVSILCIADNYHAINLYKKFGFETECLCKKYTLRDGMPSDVYQMVRFRRKQVSSNLKLHKGF